MKRSFFKRSLSLLSLLLLLVSMLFAGTSCSSGTYLKVGEAEVSYDVLRCFVKQALSGYSEEELADEALRDEIRSEVLTNIKSIYASRAIAREFGIKLDRTGKQEIKLLLASYKDLDGYDEMLEEMFATDEVIEELEICTYYDNLVYDYLCENHSDFSDDPTVVDADLDGDRWYAAEFVILLYDDTNYYARKEDLEEAREAILAGAGLKAGTATVATLYGNEYSYAIDGCFTDTIYTETVEKAVKELAVGETSEVLTTVTSNGYACLMLVTRSKVSREYVEANYDTVTAYYLARVYADYMEARVEELEIIFANRYSESDILNIK